MRCVWGGIELETAGEPVRNDVEVAVTRPQLGGPVPKAFLGALLEQAGDHQHRLHFVLTDHAPERPHGLLLRPHRRDVPEDVNRAWDFGLQAPISMQSVKVLFVEKKGDNTACRKNGTELRNMRAMAKRKPKSRVLLWVLAVR